MSLSESISASSLQQLEDSRASTPSTSTQRRHASTDNTDDATNAENVPLPESASFSSPRMQADDWFAQNIPATETMDQSSIEEQPSPPHAGYFEDEYLYRQPPVMPCEVEPQSFGLSIRDTFRSESFDIESFLSETLGIVDEDGCNLLHIAVDSAQTHTVALLLDRNADTEARDGSGQTALHHAVSRADTSILHLLVERGADVEAVANDGARPLWMAVNLGKENIATQLLECDANIESFNSKTGTTALFEAVRRGDISTARVLLENGADVDARIVAASAQTPPPLSCGEEHIHAASSHSSPIVAKPKKRFASGAVLAWMSGWGNKSAHSAPDKYRRTTQWLGSNESRTDLSSFGSSGVTLEIVDEKPAATTSLSPPPKSPPLSPAVTESTQSAVISNTDQGENKAPREGGSNMMPTTSIQETGEFEDQDRPQEAEGIMQALKDTPQTAGIQEDATLNHGVEAHLIGETQEKDEKDTRMKGTSIPNGEAASRLRHPSAQPENRAGLLTLPNAIHFHDHFGRKFIFSFELAKDWHVSDRPSRDGGYPAHL